MEMYNQLQTDFTDLKLPKDIEEELRELITGIPFIQNLVSLKRDRISDVPKDKQGRLIPNLTNPHILEDMDYFREAAIHWKKHKCYTRLTPNKHPKSAYRKFWAEEKRRCLKGMVRKSDGEWISGYYYFYLNYSPILQTITDQDNIEVAENLDELSGNIRADRVEDFPKVWDGDYLYFHYLEKAEILGKFGTVLKCRGRGYSLKAGSMPVRNALLIPKSRSFLMAHDKKYLEGDGLWVKTKDVLDFNAKYTPFPRLRYIDRNSDFEITMGYQSKGQTEVSGIKSLIKGIAFQGDEGKARGIRGKLIEWEEAGKFPALLDAWGIAESSLKQGKAVFGFQVAFGTGGEEDSNFEALESFFRSPDTYNILSLPNVYDLNADQSEKVAMFVPEYLNREYCYDENGNSDVIAALIEALEERKIKKYSLTDSFAIVREKAEHPITPIEAMMRKSGTYFPVHDLNEVLVDIKVNFNKFLSTNIAVDLSLKDGEVYHSISTNTPIRNYPLGNHDPRGSVEIFELPKEDSDGKVNNRRYILGGDPVDDDFAVKGSLANVWVFDMFTDKFVAEYTGRPRKASEYYEICRRLCIMYNGKINYENNKKGFIEHFKNANSLMYLETTPEILMEKEVVKSIGHGNNLFGTPATKAVNHLALELLSEWVSELNPIPIIKWNDQTGEKETIQIQNMRKIKSVAFIEEMIKWNPDGNFDRISGAGMIMISRANRLRFLENDKKAKVQSRVDDKFLKSVFKNQDHFTR